MFPLFTNHSYKNKMMDKIVSFPHLLYKQAEIDLIYKNLRFISLQKYTNIFGSREKVFF